MKRGLLSHKSLIILGFVIGLLSLLIPGSIATAEGDLDLDHFKCYRTPHTIPIGANILLEDQFDRAAKMVEQVQVGRAVRFCNPVEKSHGNKVTPIKNPDAHLKLYRITTSAPAVAREVVVSNQFDPAGNPQTLIVTRPRWLFVPTQKHGHQKPQGLDHFKCYWAAGQNVKATVDLKDQFDTEKKVKVLSPVLFCNPVMKLHDDVVTPIQNPDAHLVCYRITGKKFAATVSTDNQFGPETFTVTQARPLCVPSKKLSWKVVE